MACRRASLARFPSVQAGYRRTPYGAVVIVRAPSDPITFQGLTPYLFVEDPGVIADWYERVFGFVERSRWTRDDGTVENLEMTVGDGELWLEGGAGRPTAQWVGVWVDDVDAMYARVRAAGVEASPPSDKPYGVRELTVADPDGYQWGFMRRIDQHRASADERR